MSRPIDADKLLSDIEKYHVSDGKFQHWVEIQPTIEPERNTGEWIPCSEALPPDEERVLCCTMNKKGGKNLIIGYYVNDYRRWCVGVNSNVIAWQPLPEPYEGRNDD